ncbi:MAG: CapA family protein, partial [bacterium]
MINVGKIVIRIASSLKGTNFAIFLLLAVVLVGAGAWYTIRPAIKAGDQSTASDSKTITVIAGGDVSMGRQTGQKILAGEIDYPFVNIADTLKSADVAFVNLESQLADLDGETESPTSEYRFAGPPEGAQSLANAGIDIVSVANNHMWDYGKARLEETLKYLTDQEILYVGANIDTEKIYGPKIIEVRGKKIAFLAMTNILNGYENAGANQYVSFQRPDRIIEEIGELRDKVDWIFVSVHSGTEYAAEPSSQLVELTHSFIDAGADAVIGHHPHVPQKIEIYNGRPIFYSLGNFAFWQPFSFWTQNSFLAKFKLTTPHK